MFSNPLRKLLAALLILLFVAACGAVPPSLSASTAVPTTPSTATTAPAAPTATLPPAVTSAPASSQGAPLPPLGNFPSLRSIHMLDASNGWGWTDTQVLRTTDGGTSWLNATPTGVSAAPAGSFFLNVNTAWLLFGGTSNSGTLDHTTDGGSTWTSTAVPFNNASVQFVDPNNGWALVGLGAGMSHEAVAVFRTGDGGATWSQVFTDDPQAPNTSDTLPFVGDKSGLAASDTNHAWVTGSEPMSDLIYVFMTQDGGHTWTGQNPALPSAFAGAMTNADPPRVFANGEMVLPVGVFANTNATLLYVSHDGGQTWSATTPVPLNGRTSIPTATDFFVWDGGPTLSASHDGGATWSNVSPNINVKDNLAMFQFTDANTGWAITSDSTGSTFTLYRTQDGGANWDTLNP